MCVCVCVVKCVGVCVFAVCVHRCVNVCVYLLVRLNREGVNKKNDSRDWEMSDRSGEG